MRKRNSITKTITVEISGDPLYCDHCIFRENNYDSTTGEYIGAFCFLARNNPEDKSIEACDKESYLREVRTLDTKGYKTYKYLKCEWCVKNNK